MLDFNFGAILKISGLFVFFDFFVIARIKKFKISKMCCHGLIALGFLISIFLEIYRHLKTSGIILYLFQSPPPIILPARKIIISIFF